jgi:mercuric reductase
MTTSTYDLAIVGSGSAAFAAAIRGTDLGARVAVIERGTVGGTCVNIGCIPSKALIAAATARNGAASSRFAGISTSAAPVDMAALVASKAQLVEATRKQKYEDIVDVYGFDLIRATASFADPETLLADEQPVRADRYLIATGARPAIPPIAGLAETGFITSTEALELETLPERLVVVGGNYIGLELAQMFARLGATVTILEALDRVAPFEDSVACGGLAGALRADGIDVVTGARVERVERVAVGKRVLAVTDAGVVAFEADELLVATGRAPNTSLLDLERADVATDARGFVSVDATMRTTNPHVYAAGDVTGGPQFVYVAAQQGSIAADNALGDRTEQVDYTALPRITFTSPQLAAVGLTEEEARERGFDIVTSTLPVEYVPRALVEGERLGLFKLVAEAGTNRLLGATIVAEGAGDVILAALYAIKFELTLEQITSTWAPYLTMGEGLKLAAQALDRDVAHLSCCAV